MIIDSFKQNKPVFSLEVFPPKKSADINTIYKALDAFKELKPAFISVTYGAGGSTSKSTADIASYIKNECNIEALSHLTCASLQSKEALTSFVSGLKNCDVHNILALRGDQPNEMSREDFDKRYFKYASDLVAQLTKTEDFCIAGACYPEKHPEAASFSEDLSFLKQKVDIGVDFLITQLFFDNEKFYRFLELARATGINVPITAGLMPITVPSQITNMLALSEASIPPSLQTIIDKYGKSRDDLKKAGIEYTKKQMDDLLAHGVQGIHLYSMNKVDVAKAILS